MKLYVGSSKRKCTVGKTGSFFKIFSPSSISESSFNGIVLKTSEGYMLLDSSGAYLTAKES